MNIFETIGLLKDKPYSSTYPVVYFSQQFTDDELEQVIEKKLDEYGQEIDQLDDEEIDDMIEELVNENRDRSQDPQLLNDNDEPKSMSDSNKIDLEQDAIDREKPVEEARYRIELFKNGKRSTPEDKLKEQIQYIVGRVMSGSRNRRWELVGVNHTYKFDSMVREHNYRASIVLKPIKIDEKTEQEFLVCHKMAHNAGISQRWQCEDPEEHDIDMTEKLDADIDFTGSWYEDNFDHIYGRKNQIDIIMSALKAGIESEFENRFHCVMFGAPACGKTEIARAFKNLLGDDAVMEFDATSTTQAGAIKTLKEREIMPKVLFIEEMEKTDENSLRWLLSVLDHRGEIRKVNFREDTQKNVKLLCVATVNDYKLFNTLLSGAVASRFAHHIYCPRPDDEILRMILTREVAKVSSGKLEWIDAAIEFAHLLEITDPRKVTAICLCGMDDLLDGSYQRKMIACLPPADQDKYKDKLPKERVVTDPQPMRRRIAV